MIIFENENDVFTKLAQSYIEAFINILDDIYEDEKEKAEEIGRYFPKLVYLENKEKCITTFFKIQEWARDDFFHTLGSLEKYAIIMLLYDMDEEINSLGIDAFCKIYFQKNKKEIITLLKETFTEEIQELEENDNKKYSNKDILNWYINGTNFMEVLFQDLDETYIELFVGKEDFSLAILDEFDYDILPNDIVERSKKAKKLLSCSIDSFLNSFKEIIEKSYYRIHGFKEYKEYDFQLLFELYARSYNAVSLEFKKVFREVEIGDGKCDFILNFPFCDNVLFELKIDRKDKIQQAILHQIPEYMVRINVNKAFLIIFSNTEANTQYLEICKMVYKEKGISIYPFMINISEKCTPSRIKCGEK